MSATSSFGFPVILLFVAACGSDVTTPAGPTGGAAGAGGIAEPSHCVGLDHSACCAENVNGCLWMDFLSSGTRRRGECAAESDMCGNDAPCPDEFLCRRKFSEGICDDGGTEDMGVCYSPAEWDCPPEDSDPCTWIGD